MMTSCLRHFRLEFATPDDYVREAQYVELREGAQLVCASPKITVTTVVTILEDLALMLKAHPEAALLVSSDQKTWYPFQDAFWCSGFSDSLKQGLDFGFYKTEQGALRSWFEASEEGGKYDNPASLPEALCQLSSIISGKLDWFQFGDEFSQNTLLEKGQFYWQDSKKEELVPVDNFVFRASDKVQYRIAGCGGRSVVTIETAEGAADSDHAKWFPDHARSLIFVAELLQFGQNEALNRESGSFSNEPISATEPAFAHGTVSGFVESIYSSKDRHPIQALVFKTKQNREVWLQLNSDSWRVKANDAKGEWRQKSYPANDVRAIRQLARILDDGRRATELN